MCTRIPYSARIGLPVRQYVGEAARKPILPATEEFGRKKKEKIARNATEFLISVDLGKVWPPLLQINDFLLILLHLLCMGMDEARALVHA